MKIRIHTKLILVLSIVIFALLSLTNCGNDNKKLNNIELHNEGELNSFIDKLDIDNTIEYDYNGKTSDDIFAFTKTKVLSTNVISYTFLSGFILNFNTTSSNIISQSNIASIEWNINVSYNKSTISFVTNYLFITNENIKFNNEETTTLTITKNNIILTLQTITNYKIQDMNYIQDIQRVNKYNGTINGIDARIVNNNKIMYVSFSDNNTSNSVFLLFNGIMPKLTFIGGIIPPTIPTVENIIATSFDPTIDNEVTIIPHNWQDPITNVSLETNEYVVTANKFVIPANTITLPFVTTLRFYNANEEAYCSINLS